MNLAGPQIDQRKLDQAAEMLRARCGAPGAVIAFVDSTGRTLTASAGFADLEARTAMLPSHRMLGGSTGKSIFAATALGLALQGKIDLDLPISNWLGTKRWFAALPNAPQLTLRLLLHHAAGIPDHMGLPDLMPRLRAMVERAGPDAFLEPEQGVEMIAGMDALSPPGQFFYSDTGYVIAGLTLEAAFSQSLYDLAREVVLSPLQMLATEPSLKRSYANLAVPYLPSKEKTPIRMADANGTLPYSPRTEWAGGGFVTSARDLATFVHHYAGGTLFDSPYLTSVTDIVRYSWGPKHLGGYGLGIFAARSVLGPTFGHGGYYPGSLSQMMHFPDLGVSVAYQINQSSAFDTYADIVDVRKDAARRTIANDEPLSDETDQAVRLAAFIVGEPILS
jgi:D-alanyl-D-alanine carboxypeptidase